MAMETSKDSELLAAMDRYAQSVRAVKVAQATHRGALVIANEIRDTQVLPAHAAMLDARAALDAVIDSELGCQRGRVAA